MSEDNNGQETPVENKLEKYIKDNSIQKEGDLVFPDQDWKTLEMNIQRIINH